MSTPDSPPCPTSIASNSQSSPNCAPPKRWPRSRCCTAPFPVETGSRFAELLAIINDISGPNYAVDASLNLLDAVQDSGDLALVVAAAPTLADPISALALAQLLCAIRQD